MDNEGLVRFVRALWEAEITSELVEYVAIPAKSPQFDPDWQANGHIEHALEHMTQWAWETLATVPGATLEVVRLEGRTPLILIEAPGEIDDTVLLYGHLDKQPEMTGWSEGLGPWSPVIRDDRLYGRGGADDGYALYACVTALAALAAQGVPRARCLILIEGSEESGSQDLPFYVEHLAGRIGTPSLVICLDSGCGNYDQLWVTTSLRGMINGLLTVEVLSEGVHSGDASGIVPDSFRLARALLSRIEDEETGEIRIPGAEVQVPPGRRRQAAHAAAILGEQVWRKFPFAGETAPLAGEGADLVLARTWRAQLAVTGAEGLPATESAGNVLRPATTLKLSLRLPPTAEAAAVERGLVERLTERTPQGASVRWESRQASSGWDAPPLEPWLESALRSASTVSFGREAALMGEGGSIPFIGMLGARFPQAQFVVTGVLGPHSNAHGPNEFLHLPTAANVTICAALLLAAHGERLAAA
jgi:acetylornithine deacetylase/succinyl-diaminopimelate desuccinylase-like protein